MTTPTSFGDTIILGSVQGTLYQINKEDGSLLWEYKHETLDAGFSAPVTVNDTHLIALSNERILYSFALIEQQNKIQVKSTSSPSSMIFSTMGSP